MLFWGIILVLLLIGLWIRDELRKAPLKEENPIAPQGYTPEGFMEEHVPVTREETDAFLKAFGIEGNIQDYTKDEEFCRKHPCDYMKPHRFPNGKLIYCCTDSNVWERCGITQDVLRDFNEHGIEMCARHLGIPCRGGSKEK